MSSIKHRWPWVVGVILLLGIYMQFIMPRRYKELLFAGVYFTVSYIQHGNIFGFAFIKPNQARKMWGEKPFDAVIFRKHPELRAAMVYDLVVSKRLLGVAYNRIPEILGPKDGDYYLSDEVLTYNIYQSDNPDPKKKIGYNIVVSHRDNVVHSVLIWRNQPLLDENQSRAIESLSR